MIELPNSSWFQSTHPDGVRRSDTIETAIINPSFNPRTHTECDTTRCGNRFWRICFNPRTHTECDVNKRVCSIEEDKFQSTHPHGVRLRSTTILFRRIIFNPRTPTECDPREGEAQSLGFCFNPRTPTECDQDMMALLPTLYVSIHAPPRSATAAPLLPK